MCEGLFACCVLRFQSRFWCEIAVFSPNVLCNFWDIRSNVSKCMLCLPFRYLYNRDQFGSSDTKAEHFFFLEGQENSCLFYRWTPVKHKSVQDLSLFLLSLSDNGVMTWACGSDSTKTDWVLMSLFAGTEIVDRKSVQQERMCSYHSERQRPP